MPKVFDHLHGVTIGVVSRTKSGAVTETPFNPIRQVPARIAKLCANAGIVPPASGYLDIEKVNEAFSRAGFGIQKRMEYKSDLARAGLIAP
jgi:hypothetical protein